MSILQFSSQSLSFTKSLSITPTTLTTTTQQFSHLTFKTTPIRMGGGPRTFPGGVSKWQWKRMQAKKAKQLLKARLARERQIYEMRKRAELKAAVSELERPWESVEKPPNLFSVSADEQLKVLADRFQRPGGLDLWSDSDGPELFRHDNGLPSARFFPKGVVHSVKPYGKVANLGGGGDGLELGGGLVDGEISGGVAKVGVRGNGESTIGLGDGSGNGRISGSGVRGNGRSIGRNDRRLELGEGRNVSRRGEESRSLDLDEGLGKGRISGSVANVGVRRNGKSMRRNGSSLDLDERRNVGDLGLRSSDGVVRKGKSGVNGNRRIYSSDSEKTSSSSGNVGFYRRNDSRLDLDERRNVSDLRLRSTNAVVRKGTSGVKGNRRKYSSDSEETSSDNVGFNSRNDRRDNRGGDSSGQFRRSRGYEKGGKMNSEVFDMSLRNDGTYGFELED